MFTLFAFFIAAVAPTSLFAQARGRQHSPAILYPPPPESVKGLWDTAQVVLRARVETVGSPLLSSRKLVERLHGLRVVELLKGPSDFPKTFRLSLPGGTVSVDGVEHVTDYEREIVDVGDEALLFLIPMREAGDYALAFGPAGFFALSYMRDPSQPMGSTRVKIPPRAQRIRELVGRTSIELEELLRIIRPDKSETNRLSEIREALTKTAWFHFFEEDGGGITAYRPRRYIPTYGKLRRIMEFKADGTFVQTGPGPDDDAVTNPGRWRLTEGMLELEFDSNLGIVHRWKIESLEEGLLRVRKE